MRRKPLPHSHLKLKLNRYHSNYFLHTFWINSKRKFSIKIKCQWFRFSTFLISSKHNYEDPNLNYQFFDTPAKCIVLKKNIINVSLLFSVKPSKTTSFHQERHWPNLNKVVANIVYTYYNFHKNLFIQGFLFVYPRFILLYNQKQSLYNKYKPWMNK